MSDSSSESVATDFKTLREVVDALEETRVVQQHPTPQQEDTSPQQEEIKPQQEEIKPQQEETSPQQEEMEKDVTAISGRDDDIVAKILPDMQCIPQTKSKQEEVKQEAADTPSNSDIHEDDNLSQEISDVEGTDNTSEQEREETDDTDETEDTDDIDNTEVKKEHEIPFPITCTFTLLMLVYGVKATALLLGFMNSVCKSTCECAK
jgi:hypothetical protein